MTWILVKVFLTISDMWYIPGTAVQVALFHLQELVVYLLTSILDYRFALKINILILNSYTAYNQDSK